MSQALRLSLDNQQQTKHQRLPHPHTRAGGEGPAPHRTANFCTFTSLITQQLTPSLDLKLDMPSSKLEWSAGGLRNGPPPGPGIFPGTSMGIHIRMLMKFLLTAAIPGAYMGATHQLLSAANMVVCPAVLHTASEATKLGIRTKGFVGSAC
eukprot:1149248-Pelagomonas_calceolata.AAC.4